MNPSHPSQPHRCAELLISLLDMSVIVQLLRPFIRMLYMFRMFPAPGSVAPLPLVWYPLTQKNHPCAFYLQHFRVMASHLHIICSIPEPQPSTCDLFVAFRSRILPNKIPRYYLCTTCMLFAYCLCTSMIICISFPLIYDQ